MKSLAERCAWLLLFTALLGGCSAPVATALGEEDANQILLALHRAGVGAEKEQDPATEGRFQVLVHRDEVSRAVAVLHDEDLPPHPSPGVLDALGKSSLIPSTTVEHAQYIAGLSGDLERTLVGIDGIVTARVHISSPPRQPFDTTPLKATASVLLKYRGATAPVTPEATQQLVAGAVAGLAAENVAVVMVPRLLQTSPPTTELTKVGPVSVTRGTASQLRAMFAIALAASILPTLALLLVWQRSRRALAAALNPEDGGSS